MNTPISNKEFNTLLLELVQAHGGEAEIRGDEVVVENALVLSAKKFDEWKLPDGRVGVQIDFFITPQSSARTIKQSLAGWGKDESEAAKLAFENFNRSTLHIVLGAFLSYSQDITVENWNMDGKKWKVFFESIVYLCADPETNNQLKNIPIFDTLQTCIQKNSYSEKTNWVSFFVSGNNLEVLLNNEPWAEAKEVFTKLSWPQTGHYFSARIFLIFTEE